MGLQQTVSYSGIPSFCLFFRGIGKNEGLIHPIVQDPVQLAAIDLNEQFDTPSDRPWKMTVFILGIYIFLCLWFILRYCKRRWEQVSQEPHNKDVEARIIYVEPYVPDSTNPHISLVDEKDVRPPSEIHDNVMGQMAAIITLSSRAEGLTLSLGSTSFFASGLFCATKKMGASVTGTTNKDVEARIIYVEPYVPDSTNPHNSLVDEKDVRPPSEIHDNVMGQMAAIITLSSRVEGLTSSFIKFGDVGIDGFRDGGSTVMEATASSLPGGSGDTCNPLNVKDKACTDPKDEQVTLQDI
ncbi:uncharacterized protein [Erythrolamprus reginae]|uniref:uncharacterized protein n=1 Tax=Erythrolamprus reginae TaxID=121349 RepID=UPI00396CD95F